MSKYSGVECPVCAEAVEQEDLLEASGCNDGEPSSTFTMRCPAQVCRVEFTVHVDWEPEFVAGKVAG